MIASTIAGRQNTVEFNQAIQDVRDQIQQVVDQVGQGFYPNLGFSCSVTGNTPRFAVSGTDTQGTSTGCTFLGKAIQFQDDQFIVYTVVGLQCTALSVSCAGPATAPFRNVSPTIVNVPGHTYEEFATTKALEFGLTTVQSATQFKGAQIGSIGFLMEPGTLAPDGNANSFASGAQQIDFMAIGPTVNLTTGVNTAVQKIEAALENPGANDGVNDPNPVRLCFASAGTNQSGLITIGNAGRQLSVNLDIHSGRNC